MKKIIIFSIILFVISYVTYQNSINTALDKNGEDVQFVVSTGEGVNQISVNLYEKNLIKSKFFFEVYLWQKKLEEKIQAGTYVFNPKMTIKQISEALIIGKTITNEITIKTIEGWTSKQVGQYFENKGMFQSEELLELVGFPNYDYKKNKENLPPLVSFKNDFSVLVDKPEQVGLEGYLFPDTYRIYRDASLVDVVKKMLGNLENKFTLQMKNDIKSQGKTIYEIITMASIIEKEVRTEKDMKTVSGVFWNRIKNMQALESCATLAYILGENKPQYSIEDTKIDSPYNTYQNRGLPPGPVCNPGIQAIRSAIYPEFTSYNFFLSRPDTGETVFSSSYQEHLRNKNKYLTK